MGRIPWLVGAFLFLATVVSLSARERWVYLESPHFSLVSNAGERKAKKVLREFEQFNEAVSDFLGNTNAAIPGITIYLFDDDRSFRDFKPLVNGQPATIHGYYNRSGPSHVIALSLERSLEETLPVIYHEYVHTLTGQIPGEIPLWLNEGLAEVYATFELEKDQYTVGKSRAPHLLLLQRAPLMPLDALFAVDRRSPEYNERSRQGMFYAQSWALTHYLLFGEERAGKNDLLRFIDLLAKEKDQAAAFTAAFGADLAAVRRKLAGYLKDGYYNAWRFDFEPAKLDRDIHSRKLPADEASALLGRLLLAIGRVEDAERRFKDAVADAPESPHAHAGLALLGFARQNFPEAKRHIQDAIRFGSRDWLVRLIDAELRVRDVVRGAGALRSGSIAEEEARGIRAALSHCIRERPNLAQPHYLMAIVELGGATNLQVAEAYLDRALQLDPGNKQYRMTLAQVQAQRGNREAAIANLRRIVRSDDDVTAPTRDAAKALLKQIEPGSREDDDAR